MPEFRYDCTSYWHQAVAYRLWSFFCGSPSKVECTAENSTAISSWVERVCCCALDLKGCTESVRLSVLYLLRTWERIDLERLNLTGRISVSRATCGPILRSRGQRSRLQGHNMWNKRRTKFQTWWKYKLCREQ